MLNVKQWAEDNLPEDDVPLTESERNLADTLLASVSEIDNEATRSVLLTDTSIEILQHGLVLVLEVFNHRHDWLYDNEGDPQYGKDILDSKHNVRQLYKFLENAKTQDPI